MFDLNLFASRVGSWTSDPGPDSDVVVSCRIRLARNLQGFPFVSRLDESSAVELAGRVQAELTGVALDGDTIWVAMDQADPILRQLLRERHLVSRELVGEGPQVAPGRAVAFGQSELLAIMVNEEDHLRMQGMASGFDLGAAWQRVHGLDRHLEDRIPFATSQRFGYLTACPTNVGTGLRASVMLHLAGLGMVRSELEKVFMAAQRTGLAVRGMYGEGSRAAGDFYQISNQVTLGRTEEQLMGDLEALVPSIVAFERRVRETLQEEQPAALKDRVHRSWGILRSARFLATDVALQHLSNLRLGICLGMYPGVDLQDVMQLAIHIQKGHVQTLGQEGPERAPLEADERDRLRARFLRERFSEES